MDEMVKPVVVVSRCLGFEACRYNGITIPNEFIESLKKHVIFKPVCPEVEIRLGVPRNPVRIVRDKRNQLLLYQPATGKDITNKMKSFVSDYLQGLDAVDGFILKYKSPSCGMKNVRIYHSKNTGAGASKGGGFFGSAVLKKYSYLPVEDEGRLRNSSIRENFLIKAFTYARFRAVKTPEDLLEFHTNNKFLLMAYNQRQLSSMGKIAAGRDKGDFSRVLQKYRKHLRLALSRFPRASSFTNVLQHAFGGFKKNLPSQDKAFFLNALEEYRDERIPLTALTYMLKAWSLQFGNEYLKNQTFFNPFPPELMETEDNRFRKRY